MHTAICDQLGCDVSIFAFSHCRDVVAAVTKAGGFGVLGCALFSPEQLAIELDWLDAHTDGRPYGVDIVMPSAYDHRAEAGPDELVRLIPAEQRDFIDGILREAGVPELEPEEAASVRKHLAEGRGGMTYAGARRLVDASLSHSQVKLVVSALGPPPPDIMEKLRAHGIVVGAMCGKAKHAERQVAAGVDIVIAQGTEAGGHTGEISTMVLVPEVIRAVGDRATVLAAGGIGHGSQIAAAFALGAQGVWCGTIWLGTRESELGEFERSVLFDTGSDGTIRSKARTGKTVRMIRSQLSDAWDSADAPETLPAPLQGVLYSEAQTRVIKAERRDLYSAPTGQIVGAISEESTVADVMYRLQEEYLETMDLLVAMAGNS